MEKIKSDFKKKVNIEKAYNNSKISLTIISISLSTYILPLILKEIDFGFILEIISFILLIVARQFIKKCDEDISRICIVLAMIPIITILIYDFFSFIYYAEDAFSYIKYGYYYYIGEFLLFSYIISLFRVIKNLLKADDPEKYRETTDWFYEDEDDKNTKE